MGVFSTFTFGIADRLDVQGEYSVENLYFV